MRGQILPKLLFHVCFVIGPVPQIHLRLAIAFEGDDVGADAVEELFVANFSIFDFGD